MLSGTGLRRRRRSDRRLRDLQQQTQGIGKGDVVALHSPNTIVFPVVFYATTTAGGTVTTLSPLATPEEMAKQLIDSGARLLVSVSVLLGPARAAVDLVRRDTGAVIEVLVCDEADATGR